VRLAHRRKLGLWFRIVASLVMLVVLVTRVDIDTLVPEWTAATPRWIVAAIAMTALGVVLGALRWQAVLTGLERHEKLPALIQYSLAGLFVGNFLPSTLGGDVVRIRRVAGHDGDFATAFASIVLDRLTGMLVLPVITLGALATNSGLRELGPASALAAILSVATLVVLGLVLVLVSHPNVGGRLTGTSRWREVAGAVHLGADRFRRHPKAVVELVVVAFAYQIVMVLAALLAARSMHIHEVGLTAALAFVPAVAIAQTIPISVGGLGVREAGFVLFLDPLGVPRGSAVGLGLFIYALSLIVSLAGAPSFAFGSRARKKEPEA
jgi:uncharacterized membrane protein YbhN (UPF0104 family)